LPRRGRPALADEVRRGHASTVLLTPSEWDGVREAAAAAGLPPSVYIRRAALFAVRNLRPTVLVDPAVDRG
jgi:hypothetical protein